MEIDLDKLKQNKSLKELLEFGIINIDKPSGPTSFDISDLVRKMLGLRKTSHFGTLDPKVTGVLPIALNRGCKLTGFFLGEDKEYVGIMRLHEPVPEEKLRKTLKEFLGKIMQLPPVKSRVKRQEREREIKSFEILEIDDKDILFKTEVQGGTYIRKLVHDIGEKLGIGAHMLELRRTRAGIFEEEKSYTLYQLEEALKDEKKLREMIIPGETVIKLFPVAQIKEKEADGILHGQPIYDESLTKKVNLEKGQKFCGFSGDKFIGIFTVISEGRVFAKSEFVLQPIK